MKLIEAMRQIEILSRKQSDLREKIKLHCVHTSLDTPMYGEKTRETVSGWLQGHEDISQEIARLKVAIMRTNIATMVPITIGGKVVEKSIAEWIVRRGGKDKAGLAKADQDAWAQLTDRGMREGALNTSPNTVVEVKLIRNYDPPKRDEKLALYREEPALIDATLEIVNATTELLDK